MKKSKRWMWIIAGALSLFAMGSGCTCSVDVKASYEVKGDVLYVKVETKPDLYVNLRDQGRTFYGDSKTNADGVATVKVKLRKRVKAGQYPVLIDVHGVSAMFRPEGKTRINVQIPVRAYFAFKGCEKSKGVPIELKAMPKGSTNYCHVSPDGSLMLKFQGTPGATVKIAGKSEKISRTEKVEIELNVADWFMKIPLKAVAVELDTKKSKKYKSTYISTTGMKPLTKRLSASLTFGNKTIKKDIQVKLDAYRFKGIAKAVVRRAQEQKKPVKAGGKAMLLLYKNTLYSLDPSLTLGDVGRIAIAKRAGKRRVRSCRYSKGRATMYAVSYDVEVLGDGEPKRKSFRGRGGRCPIVAFFRRGDQRVINNEPPRWKIGRWLSKLK